MEKEILSFVPIFCLTMGLVCVVAALLPQVKQFRVMPLLCCWGSLFWFGGFLTITWIGPLWIRWYLCNAGLVPFFATVVIFISMALDHTDELKRGRMYFGALLGLAAGGINEFLVYHGFHGFVLKLAPEDRVYARADLPDLLIYLAAVIVIMFLACWRFPRGEEFWS